MTTERKLRSEYFDLVLDQQADGPCAYTEANYAALTGALIRFGCGDIARSFGVGGWVPCDDADPYPTLDTLEHAALDARRDGFPVLVSDVNHNGAFCGNDAANLLFRAHHDAMHVYLGEGFDLAGEAAVYAATARSLGLTPRVRATLCAEIVGQGLWFEGFGTFPTVNGRQPFAPDSAELVAWSLACEAYFGINERVSP